RGRRPGGVRGHRGRRDLGGGFRPPGRRRRPPPAGRRRARRPPPGDRRPRPQALTGRPRTTWRRVSARPWDSSWTRGVGPPPAMSTWRVARPARRWNSEERTLPLWALATGATVTTRRGTPGRAGGEGAREAARPATTARASRGRSRRANLGATPNPLPVASNQIATATTAAVRVVRSRLRTTARRRAAGGGARRAGIGDAPGSSSP